MARATRQDEITKQLNQRMILGDAAAYNAMGLRYQIGVGVKQDNERAIKLWTKAGELGYAQAYHNIVSLLV
jgi:TPR repeat protein